MLTMRLVNKLNEAGTDAPIAWLEDSRARQVTRAERETVDDILGGHTHCWFVSVAPAGRGLVLPFDLYLNDFS
jgi:hypothetical protein